LARGFGGDVVAGWFVGHSDPSTGLSH